MADAVEQLRQGIHNYFREFGYNSCEMLFNELLRHGGVGPMLVRLGLEDPGVSDDQYVCLLNYLRRHGVEVFARRVAAALSRPEAPAREESRDRRIAAEALPYLNQPTPTDSPVYQRVRAKMPDRPATPVAKGDAAPEPKVVAKPVEVKPVPAKAEAPPAQKPAGIAEVKPAAPALGPDGKPLPPGTLADGSWDGVTERRSGKERRTGKERRRDVDVVFKNKRYGGERRTGKERRKNWPPK